MLQSAISSLQLPVAAAMQPFSSHRLTTVSHIVSFLELPYGNYQFYLKT
jgi:hypothetical protein